MKLLFPYGLAINLLAPVLFYFCLRSFAHMNLLSRLISALFRSLVLLVFSLCISAPQMVKESSNVCGILLVDVSKSMPPDSCRQISRWMKDVEDAKSRDFSLNVYYFTDRIIPFSDTTGGGTSRGDVCKNIPQSLVSVDKTDIYTAAFSALTLAERRCQKRLIVFTDGLDTESSDELLATRLASLGVPLYPVVPSGAEGSEVIVEDFISPPNVMRGKEFSVKMAVYSCAQAEAKISVRDYFPGDGGSLLKERIVKLKKGRNYFPFELVLRREGKHLLSAEVENLSGRDRFIQNNVFKTAIHVEGPPRVLYIEGEPLRGEPLKMALESGGYSVELKGPGGLDISQSELNSYDAVFLSDVPYRSLPSHSVERIISYTKAGGIFVFSGGKSGYGAGGYSGTPFEKFLPVSMKVKKKIEEVPLAIVLVLDKSGSMTGLPIKMAKQAAMASVRALGGECLVEIIGFDSSPYRVFSMQSAENKMLIGSFISRLHSGGGTNIISALKMAISDIKPIPARKKHIVLLTDGQSSKSGIDLVLQKAAMNKISISTIGLGKNVDRGFLEKIALYTGGKSYFTANPKLLPRFFLRETTVTSPPAIVEGVFDVIVKKRLPYVSKVGGSVPYVRGYNLTTAKLGGNMEVLISDRGDPVLAAGRRGDGWAVAFTPDLKSRWGSGWVRWRNFGRFWVELIKYYQNRTKKKKGKRAKLVTKISGRRVDALIDLVDEQSGEFIDGATAKGLWTGFGPNDGGEFPIKQTASGRYEGSFVLPGYGSFLVDVILDIPGGDSIRASASINIPYPPEYRRTGVNKQLLDMIASASGGILNPDAIQITKGGGKKIYYSVDLTPYFVFLLIGLILIDLALRRVVL